MISDNKFNHNLNEVSAILSTTLTLVVPMCSGDVEIIPRVMIERK